ncbi:MAG TPA: molybdate ABC transporter substrate-binding protein [Casimicrobiaceae bacterium]|nr:molybdate ABC transporter substrate-binding protein [Casimicrobiaceae bacterium]
MSLVRFAAWGFGIAMATTAGAQPIVVVYAAGSLRSPMSAIAADFEMAHGQPVRLVFGASGLLRDRIVAGEPADMLASANMEHPQTLVAGGWAASVVPFARNELCALAQPRVGLDSANVLAAMLDPRWKLGTSTPKADPSGDYAWEVFRRADALRPGAYAMLSTKARQLTGGAQTPALPADKSVYGVLVAGGEADIFLTYCTNAKQAIAEEPSLVVVSLPAELRVGALYGLAARHDASAGARSFAAYVMSPAGQRTLARYGFAPP